MFPWLSSVRQSLNLLSKMKAKAKTWSNFFEIANMYVKNVFEVRKGKQSEVGSLGAFRQIKAISRVR